MTDFGLTVSGDEDKTVTGKIGSGAAHIELGPGNFRGDGEFEGSEGVFVSGAMESEGLIVSLGSDSKAARYATKLDALDAQRVALRDELRALVAQLKG